MIFGDTMLMGVIAFKISFMLLRPITANSVICLKLLGKGHKLFHIELDN